MLLCDCYAGVTINSASFLSQNYAYLNDNFYGLLIISHHYGELKKETPLVVRAQTKGLASPRYLVRKEIYLFLEGTQLVDSSTDWIPDDTLPPLMRYWYTAGTYPNCMEWPIHLLARSP